jgi:hypothetical protein
MCPFCRSPTCRRPRERGSSGGARAARASDLAALLDSPSVCCSTTCVSGGPTGRPGRRSTPR